MYTRKYGMGPLDNENHISKGYSITSPKISKANNIYIFYWFVIILFIFFTSVFFQCSIKLLFIFLTSPISSNIEISFQKNLEQKDKQWERCGQHYLLWCVGLALVFIFLHQSVLCVSLSLQMLSVYCDTTQKMFQLFIIILLHFLRHTNLRETDCMQCWPLCELCEMPTHKYTAYSYTAQCAFSRRTFLS